MIMEIYWPSDLPQVPLLGNYKHATASNTIAFKTEYGPPKVRRRTTANVSRRVWGFFLDRHAKNDAGMLVDQFQLFLDFMEAAEGMSFWFPDPTDPEHYIKVRFAAVSEETGQELVPATGDYWTATVNVEVWPHARRVRS